MKIGISIIISYLALYLVIYIHEIGHGLFYYKYGCKKHWWQVTVKPYLFFSTPQPIDNEKVKLLSANQNIVIASGGVVINLVTALLTFFILTMVDINYYVNLFLYQFLSLHLAEAVSYLVIGNIYLVSDMELVTQSKSILRPVYFVFGLFIGVLYIMFLIDLPIEYGYIVVIFNILTIVSMGVGRVLFTLIHKKKSN